MDFNQELDSMWEKDNRIAQLEAELADARKDQERYRFVRDMTPEDFGNMSTINEEFDSLVDEIIRIEKYHIPNVGKMVQSQAQQEPEVCSDGGKCGAGGYCITCPNMPAPEGGDK